jgi:hypothetical protein
MLSGFFKGALGDLSEGATLAKGRLGEGATWRGGDLSELSELSDLSDLSELREFSDLAKYFRRLPRPIFWFADHDYNHAEDVVVYVG